MKLKTKIFEIRQKNDYGTVEVNEWLKNHPDIQVVSTNTFANNTGWGYIILYQEQGNEIQ